MRWMPAAAVVLAGCMTGSGHTDAISEELEPFSTCGFTLGPWATECNDPIPLGQPPGHVPTGWTCVAQATSHWNGEQFLFEHEDGRLAVFIRLAANVADWPYVGVVALTVGDATEAHGVASVGHLFVESGHRLEEGDLGVEVRLQRYAIEASPASHLRDPHVRLERTDRPANPWHVVVFDGDAGPHYWTSMQLSRQDGALLPSVGTMQHLGEGFRFAVESATVLAGSVALARPTPPAVPVGGPGPCPDY